MTYGMGMDIDKLYNVGVQTDYNIKKNFDWGSNIPIRLPITGTIPDCYR